MLGCQPAGSCCSDQNTSYFHQMGEPLQHISVEITRECGLGRMLAPSKQDVVVRKTEFTFMTESFLLLSAWSADTEDNRCIYRSF